jgi:hypothetical protein
MTTLAVVGGAILFAGILYGSWRMASWESKLITDWLDGPRTTPPPDSAFFPQSIAREWWAEHERRLRQ